jgi:hypothetical protein
MGLQLEKKRETLVFRGFHTLKCVNISKKPDTSKFI